MMEGFRLCKALWSGEPVDWDGRWQVRQGVLAPTPYREGGPPIWVGSTVERGVVRAAKTVDGWFPFGPEPETFAQRRQLFLENAAAAGRDMGQLTTALYLTVAIMDDAHAADTAINVYLQNYYGAQPAVIRKVQACFGGPLDQVLAFIRSFVEAGAEHIVLRLIGDHDRMMGQLSRHRNELGALSTRDDQ